MATQNPADIVADFLSISGASTAKLRPILIGPDYVSRAYDDSAVKPLLSVGNYAGSSLAAAWPELAETGETVNTATVAVNIDDAAQVFYTNNTGTDFQSITANKLTFDSGLGWAANVTPYGTFNRRATVPADVIVGDWVRVTYNTTSTLVAKVVALEGTVVAATAGVPAAGGGNTSSPSAVVSTGSVFTGSVPTTFTVKVAESTASGVKITATSSTGVGGLATPTTVTSTVAVSLGSGVVVTFTFASYTDMDVNDTWTIACTPAYTSDLTTLVLDQTVATTIADTNINRVEVGIFGNVSIPKNRVGYAPTTNWTTTASQITLAANIFTTNTRTGALELLVKAGTAYVSYKALRSVYANIVNEARQESDLTALEMPGDDVDNTLAYAVRRAFVEAAGASVKFIAVATDDLAGYEAALLRISERDDIYQYVPLTQDETIIAAVVDAVQARNVAQNWTGAVLSLATPTIKNIVKLRADNSVSTATVSGTTVTDTLGLFISKGVTAGDKLRILYAADGFGGETYSEYTVVAVTSNQVLTIDGSITVGVASRYEIWRSLTATQQCQEFDAKAAAFADPAIKVVFPSQAGRGGAQVPSYFLAATIAGYRGASLPHQSLRGLELVDWDDLDVMRTTYVGQDANLTHCYVVSQNYDDTVYIKQQNTTDLTDISTREDSVVYDLHSLLWFFKRSIQEQVQRANIVDYSLAKIRGLVTAGGNYIKNVTQNPLLGPQLLSIEVLGVAQNETIRDQVDITLQMTLPAPMNKVVFTVTVTV